MKRVRRLIEKIQRNYGRGGVISFFRKKGMSIGQGCEINKSFNVISEPYLVKLGDNVRITYGVKFITHDGGLIVARRDAACRNICSEIKEADLFGRINVGNNVHIGVDTIVMPGVTIGDNVVIGAGAVVTRDIPSNSVAVGVPARVIKSITQYVEDNQSLFVYTKSMSYEEKRKEIEGKL